MRAECRPLVCLHMFPQSGRSFENFARAASTRRQIVVPDFPGYGESDSPGKPIAADDYARSVWEVVDALNLTAGWESIDLFGIHAGAKIAAIAAYQRPDAVHRMILASAAVLTDAEVAYLRERLSALPLDEDGSRFRALWQMVERNRGPGMTLEMAATALAEILRGGERYAWGHQAVFDFNERFAALLGELPHPIVLLNPNDDLYEKTPRTSDYLRNGRLIDRPGWGHGFLDVFPAEVAATVEAALC